MHANENHSENSHRVLAEIQAYGYARERLGRAKAELDEVVFQNGHSDYGRPDEERAALLRESISNWEKIVTEKAENIAIQVTVLCNYKTEVG